MLCGSKSLMTLLEVLEGCVWGTDSIHGWGFIHLKENSKEMRWEGGIKGHVYIPICAGTVKRPHRSLGHFQVKSIGNLAGFYFILFYIFWIEIMGYKYCSLGAQIMLSFQCKHHFIDSLYFHIHSNSLCVNKLPAHIIFFPKSLCIFCFDT